MLLTQKKIHQNKKRVAHDKEVLSAQFTLWCSKCFFPVILLFIAVIVPQKFQRPFLFISLFESFRYHEYQSGIIFAVVKHLPVTELSFFFKVLVDNPEEPINTKESSISLPYCGFIRKCYSGIDIQLRKTGDRVLRGGGWRWLLAY